VSAGTFEVVQIADIPREFGSLVARMVNEAIELIGTGSCVLYRATDEDNLKSVQKCIYAYGNERGYRMKTVRRDLSLYLSVKNKLTDEEFTKVYLSRRSKD
jgi:hypothetical protein